MLKLHPQVLWFCELELLEILRQRESCSDGGLILPDRERRQTIAGRLVYPIGGDGALCGCNKVFDVVEESLAEGFSSLNLEGREVGFATIFGVVFRMASRQVGDCLGGHFGEFRGGIDPNADQQVESLMPPFILVCGHQAFINEVLKRVDDPWGMGVSRQIENLFGVLDAKTAPKHSTLSQHILLPGGERLPGAVQDDGKRCVAIWRRWFAGSSQEVKPMVEPLQKLVETK